MAMCSCSSYSFMNGDLVFVEGDSANKADAAITGATGEMSHVGIIEVDGDEVYVIDASSQGVQRRPFAVFSEEQTAPMHFARLKDASEEELAGYVSNAKEFLGCGYDYAFLPDNDRYYCSELVYEAYVKDGEHIFDAVPMNFMNSEGGFDIFWVELFSEQGMDIPQDVPGTNPSDMMQSPSLDILN